MLVALFAPALRAQTHAAPMVRMAPPPAPPSSLVVGEQYYEADWDGFRTYLETLRMTEPTVYTELDLKLSAIEDQRRVGNIVVWSGVGVGAVLAIWGVTKMASGLDDSECQTLPILSPERERCDDQKMNEMNERHDQGLILLGAGLGVGAAGVLIGGALKPGRSDLLDLINDHNRARPGQPMRLPSHWSSSAVASGADGTRASCAESARTRTHRPSRRPARRRSSGSRPCAARPVSSTRR